MSRTISFALVAAIGLSLWTVAGGVANGVDWPAYAGDKAGTNMHGGKQYIVVAVSGRQSPGELIALALP